MASRGLVLRSTLSGIRAARRRRQSFSHRPGMNTSKSAQACPDVVSAYSFCCRMAYDLM